MTWMTEPSFGCINSLNTNMHTFTKHKKHHSLQVSLTRSELEIKINNRSATHRASRRCGEHSDPADLPQEPEPQPLRPNPDASALQTRKHRVTLHTRSCPEHTHTLQLLSLSDPIQTLQSYRHESTGSRFTIEPAQNTHTSIIELLRPDPDAPALQTREHRVTRHTRSCPEHTHTLQLLSRSDPIQTLQHYRHESAGSRVTLGPAQNTHISVIEPLRPNPDAPALQTRERRVTLHTRSCPEHTHFSYWATLTQSRRSSTTDTRAQGHSSHSVLPRTHTFQLLSRSDPIQTLQPYRHKSTGSHFTLGPAQNTHTLQLLSRSDPIQTLQPYRHERTGSRFTLGPAPEQT